jgi:hypothetical protein
LIEAIQREIALGSFSAASTLATAMTCAALDLLTARSWS